MRTRSTRKSTRDHNRDLALAYLGALDVSEVRLRSVVDAHINRVLAATDGRLSTASELLGIHRRSLERYVRRKARGRTRRH